MEKCVQTQLVNYLNEHQFITYHQSAYLKHHSTQTSLLKFADDLYHNIEDGLTTGICFFDISKCFDAINHNILLFKLEKYGNRGSELDWFTSYLSERLQATVLGAGPLERSHDASPEATELSVSKSMSSFLPISTWVTQGSILGSILFLIFVNDLSHYVKDANLYADDTGIKCTGHTVSDVVCSLQQEIDKLSNWFKHNHITVNPTKSCSMIIGWRHQIGRFVYNPTLGLKLDGQLIENKKTSNTLV